MRHWSDRTELPAARFIAWIGVQRGKFYDWQKRYGKANEHNALVPRDHWIEDWEREAILAFHAKNTREPATARSEGSPCGQCVDRPCGPPEPALSRPPRPPPFWTPTPAPTTVGSWPSPRRKLPPAPGPPGGRAKR